MRDDGRRIATGEPPCGGGFCAEYDSSRGSVRIRADISLAVNSRVDPGTDDAVVERVRFDDDRPEKSDGRGDVAADDDGPEMTVHDPLARVPARPGRVGGGDAGGERAADGDETVDRRGVGADGGSAARSTVGAAALGTDPRRSREKSELDCRAAASSAIVVALDCRPKPRRNLDAGVVALAGREDAASEGGGGESALV